MRWLLLGVAIIAVISRLMETGVPQIGGVITPDALLVASLRLVGALFSFLAGLAMYHLNPWRVEPPLLTWLWNELRGALGSGVSRVLAAALAGAGLVQLVGAMNLGDTTMPAATPFVLTANSAWAAVMWLLFIWLRRQLRD